MLQNVAPGYGIIFHTRQTNFWDLFVLSFFGSPSRFPTVTSLLMDQLMCHGGSHPATISELVDASSVYNLGSVDSSSQVPDPGN